MNRLPDTEPQGQASHSPGPWLAGPVGPGLAVIQGANREIAVIHPVPQWDADAGMSIPGTVWLYQDRHRDGSYSARPRDMEALANVNLMVASPDLLAACEDVLAAHIGGVAGCGYCLQPLNGDSPYSQGYHRQDCPIPGVLAAVKKARTA